MKQNSRLLFVAVLLSIVMMAVAILAIIFVPQWQYRTFLVEGDYSRLVDVYESKLQNLWGYDDKLPEDLEGKLYTAKEQFRTEQIDYSAMEQELTEIFATGYADQTVVEEISLEVEQLNTSKQAYLQAEDQYMKHKYVDALASYGQVIADDIHYADAQSRITAIPAEFRDYTDTAAAEKEKTSNFEEANQLLETYLSFAEDEVFSQRFARNQALIEADAYAQQGKFEEAEAALGGYRDDDLAASKIRDYQQRLSEKEIGA